MKLAAALAACLCLVPSASRAVPIVVDVDGGGDYTTIQAAIDAAPDGAEIEVWPGTYTGDGNRDIIFGIKNLTLRSRDGLAATIIDPGPGIHRVFDFPKSGQDTTCVIDGFTIQGGYLQDFYAGGAGIRIDGTVGSGPGPASPKFVNCLIRNNVNQLGSGGGVYMNSGCSPVFRNVRFESNVSLTGGGGVYCTADCLPQFSDCTFFNNECGGSAGGGLYCKFRSDATLKSCTFEGNAGTKGGGLACASDAHPGLTNVTFIGNAASAGGGGAIHCENASSPTLVGVTCYGNWSTGEGEALYAIENSWPVIRRSLFAFNGTQARGTSFYCDGTSGFDILQSCSFGNESSNDICSVTCGGGALICEDPLFCDPASGDLRLETASPCLPANNVWSAQIGAHGDCSQPSVQESSWGAIKSLYR